MKQGMRVSGMGLALLILATAGFAGGSVHIDGSDRLVHCGSSPRRSEARSLDYLVCSEK